MSLDIETRLRVYLASAPQAVRRIPTLQISHSAMTKTFYLWREPYTGSITVESGVVAVEPANFEAKLPGAEGHLDQQLEIRLDTVDVEDEFREQLDRIPLATTEKIVVVYREYLSDDLTDVVAGPWTLHAEALSTDIGLGTISAASPRLNMTRTGEIYAPRDVPMLRAFL